MENCDFLQQTKKVKKKKTKKFIEMQIFYENERAYIWAGVLFFNEIGIAKMH